MLEFENEFSHWNLEWWRLKNRISISCVASLFFLSWKISSCESTKAIVMKRPYTKYGFKTRKNKSKLFYGILNIVNHNLLQQYYHCCKPYGRNSLCKDSIRRIIIKFRFVNQFCVRVAKVTFDFFMAIFLQKTSPFYIAIGIFHKWCFINFPKFLNSFQSMK